MEILPGRSDPLVVENRAVPWVTGKMAPGAVPSFQGGGEQHKVLCCGAGQDRRLELGQERDSCSWGACM